MLFHFFSVCVSHPIWCSQGSSGIRKTVFCSRCYFLDWHTTLFPELFLFEWILKLLLCFQSSSLYKLNSWSVSVVKHSQQKRWWWDDFSRFLLILKFQDNEFHSHQNSTTNIFLSGMLEICFFKHWIYLIFPLDNQG